VSAETEAGRGRRASWLVFVPLLFFVALAALFLAQLMSGRDLSVVPSALIGQPAPETSLPPLEGGGLPGIDSASFAGKVTLLNVWASWCAPCREEHPLLLDLAGDRRFQLVGLNYKDAPEKAGQFLAGLGNPYSAIGVDGSGRTAIDWGVYGVPETFLIGKDGTILFKHVGPLTPEAVATSLMPAIEAALAASP
jgi:cytochrome c biogenesis protein CcmG/thiol:disulfide interchange protein DsbE